MAKPKKIHPADAAQAARIAGAVSFSVYLRLSPSDVRRADDLTRLEAEAAAVELNKISLHGRRAIVYAITREGAAIPV